jgi:hypothetical protein
MLAARGCGDAVTQSAAAIAKHAIRPEMDPFLDPFTAPLPRSGKAAITVPRRRLPVKTAGRAAND